MGIRFTLREVLQRLPDLPSNRKLAEELNIRRGTFYDILNNTAEYVSVDHISKICKRFGLQPGDWMIYQDEEL